MRLILIVAILLCLTATLAHAGQPGDFNAAPWGTPYLVKAGGSPTFSPVVTDGYLDRPVEIASGDAMQVEWRQPRDIYAVKLSFIGAPLRAEDVSVQYWYRIWPDNGDGGWMKLDDPFNGEFVTAAVDATSPAKDELLLRLKPISKVENSKIKTEGADSRQTYKIRLTFKVPTAIDEVTCLTDSNWKTAEVKVDMLGKPWNGKVEARNAEIVSISPQVNGVAIAKIRYADNRNRLSPDRGHLIVRQGGKGQDFSFFIDDVVHEGCIKVRDIDVFISDASKNLKPSDWKEPEGSWGATIIDKVASSPEQNYERAMKEIPRKWVDHAHMGLPVLRQEISIDNQSCIYTYTKSLRGLGKDVAASPKFPQEWSDRRFTMVTHKASFGPPSPNSTKRWLEDDYLPIVHSLWRDDGFDFHQTIYAVALDPAVTRKSLALPKPPPMPMGKNKKAADFGRGLKGDEPICGLAKIEMWNTTKEPRTAYYWLKPTPMYPMSIRQDGLLVLDSPSNPSAGKGLTPTWGQIETNGKGELVYLKNFVNEGGAAKDARGMIRYTITLAPGESHAIYLKIPYIEQMTSKEVAQLKALDWEKTYPQLKSLWKERLAKAVDQYNVPEPVFNSLYRANLWHDLITTDRDPSTGLYEHGAGTYAYPMYANEAMMVARSLEMRGEYEEARRIFEPCIVSQGERSLPGNFKSKDGLLYAACPAEFDYYTAQGYNMHHGFILWAAAEHYFWTGDKKYLKSVTPNLIAACDWITRERQATMVMNPDGTRPVEYGLAPADDLEDVEEYLYFYPTNAYYHLGMKKTADALAAIHHPAAARIAADAEAYKKDILASLDESIATSPAVRLLDGTYIPYVPDRAYVITDRNEGWIREALYSPLHLASCDLLEPEDQRTSWILHDLEDRIYLSAESGLGPYRLLVVKERFFSWGGFNPQPNLLDNPLVYLERGQIPHFIRAFYNIYSASIYSDVHCFSECVPPYAAGGGPVYKTSDESKFIQTMRNMLVLEDGNDLWIGRGVPKAWMTNGKTIEFKDAATFFGPVTLKYISNAASGTITADITLPTRSPAKTARICFRHPEGKKIQSVRVNGKAWKDFDAVKGIVSVPGKMGKVAVVAQY